MSKVEFKKLLTGDDIGKQVDGELSSSKEKGSFDIEFQVIRADTKYVSVKFETYFYQEGAPHGVLYYYVFNYDLKHSRKLRLADLFESNVNYSKQIIKLCKQQLDKEIGKDFYAIGADDLNEFTFEYKILKAALSSTGFSPWVNG